MTTLSVLINLLVCRAEICNSVSVYFEFDKNPKNQKSQSKINIIVFHCHLPDMVNRNYHQYIGDQSIF